MTVEAELRVPLATARLVRFNLTKLAPWRLRIIDDRLAACRAAPTLTELAGLCRLSVRQLTRGFRASRGCSIGEYVARSQLDHAKQLLATEESIKSIAYSMGFTSPSNFSTAFRRATGQTPRQFRQSELRTGHLCATQRRA